MDKRFIYIVVGTLAILYVLGVRMYPETMQKMQTRAEAMWASKSFSPHTDNQESEAGQWEQHRHEVFVSRLAESKRRAIAKYPALASADSEINIRFVYRYQCMVKDNNPRLNAPNWPELLADDCAETMHLKPGTAAPAPDAPNRATAPTKNSVANR